MVHFQIELNHHRLKSVGLKAYRGHEASAKADFPLRGNVEVIIMRFKILCGYVLHDNLVGHVAR